MKNTYFHTLMILIICCFLLIPSYSMSGSSKSKKKGGPPSHAKAHGYRAKHNYNYYPKANVYYDTSRKMYFYIEGDNWKASVSLPSTLKVQLGNHVSVEMETDKPYLKN